MNIVFGCLKEWNQVTSIYLSAKWAGTFPWHESRQGWKAQSPLQVLGWPPSLAVWSPCFSHLWHFYIFNGSYSMRIVFLLVINNPHQQVHGLTSPRLFLNPTIFPEQLRGRHWLVWSLFRTARGKHDHGIIFPFHHGREVKNGNHHFSG